MQFAYSTEHVIALCTHMSHDNGSHIESEVDTDQQHLARLFLDCAAERVGLPKRPLRNCQGL